MKKRAMKKRIPQGVYCDGCPWLQRKETYNHKREECQFGEHCNDNCSECKEFVAYCWYLKAICYGIYPLYDGCKICNVKRRTR